MKRLNGTDIETDFGVITGVKERSTDYHIDYTSFHNAGTQIFTIQKDDTLKGDFIAAAHGKRLEIMTERNSVRQVKIEGTLVFQR